MLMPNANKKESKTCERLKTPRLNVANDHLVFHLEKGQGHLPG